MKRYLLFVCLAAMAAFGLPVTVSAQQDSAATPPPVDLSKVHIIKMGVDTIHYTPEEIAAAKAWRASAAKSGRIGGTATDGIDVGDLDKEEYFGYQYATYTYPSVTSDGSEVRLSSLIAWPVGKSEAPGAFGYHVGYDVSNTNNVIVGCHVTITKDTECPSMWPSNKTTTSDVRMYVGHAGGGYLRAQGREDAAYWNVVIMPDYEGYGATKSNPHPYLDEELTARQVIDGVRYGLAWYNSQTQGKKRGQVVPLRSSWHTIVAGYSQGGAVAMAVHRLMETSHIGDSLKFAGSVCGDGPYDIMATLRQYIDWGRVYYSVAVPLILKGMVDHCPYIYGHTLEDYLSAEYLATGASELIEGKETSTDGIISSTNDYINTHSSSLTVHTDGDYTYLDTDKMMTAGAYNYCKNFSTPLGRYGTDDGAYGDLQRAFEANSLLRGWQPEHPMYLLHSCNDQVVPYVNMKNAMTAFSGNSWVRCYRAGDTSKANPWDADLSKYGHNNTGQTFLFALTGRSFEEKAIYAILKNWGTNGTDGDSSAKVDDNGNSWTKVQ